MVCEPCQKNVHSDCPEIARRLTIRRDKTLTLARAALEARCGQICDCQHGSDTL
jgi:hypothetical protein